MDNNKDREHREGKKSTKRDYNRNKDKNREPRNNNNNRLNTNHRDRRDKKDWSYGEKQAKVI